MYKAKIEHVAFFNIFYIDFGTNIAEFGINGTESTALLPFATNALSQTPKNTQSMWSIKAQPFFNICNSNPFPASIHTWDCKAGSLAQDGSEFVLDETLIEALIWLLCWTPHIGDVQWSVGQDAHTAALLELDAVLPPSHSDGRLALSLTVQNNVLAPRCSHVLGLDGERQLTKAKNPWRWEGITNVGIWATKFWYIKQCNTFCSSLHN